MKANFFAIVMASLFIVGFSNSALALQNGGFETWANPNIGPPDNWFESNNAQVTSTRAGVTVRTGSYSCRLAWTTSPNYLAQKVDVSGGQCWRFSFYAKDSSLVADTLQAAITWLNSSGGVLSTSTGAKVQIPKDQWKWVSTGNRLAPVSADTARVEIRTHQSGLCWVDDASFQNILPGFIATIYEIQFNDIYRGAGKPMYDCFPTLWIECPIPIVVPGGIVTAGDPYGFWMQDDEAPWSGIYVSTGGSNPQAGDEVEVEAEVAEDDGATQLTYATVSTMSTGNPLPAPLDITTGDLAGGCNANSEAYEGVLVRVTDPYCTQDINENGEWYICDGTDECQVDDRIYAYDPHPGEAFEYIIGVVHYSDGEYELLPRDASDFGPTVAVELMSFEATAHEGYVALSWETAAEINAHSFNIYRDDHKIVSVPARGEAHSYLYVDRTVTNGVRYSYQLSSVDLDGHETRHDVICEVTPMALPVAFTLSQNYPNPFNPGTEIRYALSQRAHVILKVYNLLGQEVIALVDEIKDVGQHTASWNGLDAKGKQVASGIYLYRLETAGFSATRKMVFIK